VPSPSLSWGQDVSIFASNRIVMSFLGSSPALLGPRRELGAWRWRPFDEQLCRRVGRPAD